MDKLWEQRMIERNGRKLPAEIQEAWDGCERRAVKRQFIPDKAFFKGFLVAIPIAMIFWGFAAMIIARITG